MKFFEVINMCAALATTFALIIAIIVLIFNKNAIALQRKSMQANLFNDLSKDINALFKEKNKHLTRRGKRKKSYENWLDRLLLSFEYFAYYANRGYLSDDMAKYYVIAIDAYCEKAKEFPELIEDIEYYKDKEAYCEIRLYYYNYIKKPCPF